jgi:putative phosphoesterase
MRVGLISDSHLHSDRRPLWDEVAVAFDGVDLIFHAGDMFGLAVLDWLERIAPVKAALGNNDDGNLSDPRLKRVQMLDLEGWRVAVIHDMEPEDQPIEDLRRMFLEGRSADIFITGHTHYERIDYRDGVLQINPGSPTLPHNFSTRLGTVGLLDLERDHAEVRIVRLGESAGLRNPGVEHTFSVRHPRLRD